MRALKALWLPGVLVGFIAVVTGFSFTANSIDRAYGTTWAWVFVVGFFVTLAYIIGYFFLNED